MDKDTNTQRHKDTKIERGETNLSETALLFNMNGGSRNLIAIGRTVKRSILT